MEWNLAGRRAEPARAGGRNVVQTLFDKMSLAGRVRHRLALRSWRVISIGENIFDMMYLGIFEAVEG